MGAPDYRALITARVQGSERRTVRKRVCLAPSLFGRRDEVRAELDAALRQRRSGGGDMRAGDVDPVTGLLADLSAVEQQITDATVVAVFRTPTLDEQAVLNRDITASDGDDVLGDARRIATDFWERCETPSGDPVDIERADWAALVTTFTQGELLDASNSIVAAAGGVPDFPTLPPRSVPTAG